MYGKIKAAKPSAFGELGNVGEALFRGLGQQAITARVKVGTPLHVLDLADYGETASALMVMSILPKPDQAAIEDIIDAAMSVDHLPVVINDHRILEALTANR